MQPTSTQASAMTETPTTGWRASKWLAFAELAIVALIFLGAWLHSPLIFFSKTPYLLLLGWISLWARQVGWRRIGLTRYRSWTVTIVLGVACGILMEAFQLFASQPFLVWLTGQSPDLSEFESLRGNIALTLAGIGLVWVLAAFGEEMVYRGYLMNRVADLGNRTTLAWVASLVLVNIVFGFAHSYQGVTGIIDEGFMGLLLGLMYLGMGRNLAVPIVAHGVQDTIDAVLIYLGMYPGM
jgi:uncharacterized protein